jgi:hypothetical protein
MTSKTSLPLIVVILGVNPASVSSVVARGTAIVTAMGDAKTTFVLPPLAFATVTTHIGDLTAADTAFKNHTGVRVARDSALKLVVEDLKQLHAYVQQLANASPAQAETIAVAAAMRLRKSANRHKSDLGVKLLSSGSVHVIAKRLKGARAHLWQFSTDGGKTWLDTLPTTRADTQIHGLVPGNQVQFRHRPIMKSGVGDWSQTVTAIVT